MWTLDQALYVVGYSRLGQRVATAMEQVEGWTYTEYEENGQTPIDILDDIPSLHHAVERMKDRGVVAFVMCPWGRSKVFLDRLHQALSEGTQVQ